MSSTSYTSLSDHCNSIPSSRNVIHSEPLLNILSDVGDRDLPVLTSGNCVKVKVKSKFIKRHKKLYNKYRNRGAGYTTASHLAISVRNSKQMRLE